MYVTVIDAGLINTFDRFNFFSKALLWWMDLILALPVRIFILCKNWIRLILYVKESSWWYQGRFLCVLCAVIQLEEFLRNFMINCSMQFLHHSVPIFSSPSCSFVPTYLVSSPPIITIKCCAAWFLSLIINYIK